MDNFKETQENIRYYGPYSVDPESYYGRLAGPFLPISSKNEVIAYLSKPSRFNSVPWFILSVCEHRTE